MSVSDSAVSRRCMASLLVALLVLLAQTPLALSQTQFSFLLTTKNNELPNGKKYSVTLSATLTGTETAVGSGVYQITAVKGYRQYKDGTDDTLNSQVNTFANNQITPDNMLYYPPKNNPYYPGFYLDFYGIGFSLDAKQTIIPGTKSKDDNVFADGTNYGEATDSKQQPVQGGYTLKVKKLTPGMNGDPIITGFNGEQFLVHGLHDRVFNILSLPAVQLNTRFINVTAGQAMNATQQSAVRQRQSKLIAAFRRSGQVGAGAFNQLPSTTSWSHDGLYMGETGVQVAGHRLLVQPGAYITGFASVELDGQPVAISSEPVELLDGSTILRSSSSVVHIATSDVSFTLVNSDHFLNIHSAVLSASTDSKQVDGLLGQTADATFRVQKTAEWKRHVEADYRLAEDDTLWSTAFKHNQYVAMAGDAAV